VTNDSAPSSVRRPARLRVVDPVAAPRARLRLHRGAAVYPPIVAAVHPPVRQFTRQSASGPMDTTAAAARRVVRRWRRAQLLTARTRGGGSERDQQQAACSLEPFSRASSCAKLTS
jgi:hypothetical protein